MKDCWDKLVAIGGVLGAIAIPLAVASGTWIYQSQQALNSEKRLWVQIGIDALRDSNAQPDLRSWAIAIINENSGRNITESTAEKLVSGEWKFPQNRSGWSDNPPPPEFFSCKDAPFPPSDPLTQNDVAIYIVELRAAYADCKNALDDLERWLQL